MLEYLKQNFEKSGMSDSTFIGWYNQHQNTNLVLVDDLVCTEKLIQAAEENPNGLKNLIDRISHEQDQDKKELLLKNYLQGVKGTCPTISAEERPKNWYKPR